MIAFARHVPFEPVLRRVRLNLRRAYFDRVGWPVPTPIDRCAWPRSRLYRFSRHKRG